MTIKSAEPHIIAPRLGYLEDKVDYLASRSGGDGGTDPSSVALEAVEGNPSWRADGRLFLRHAVE